MPQPGKHRSNAERQSAYRQRCRHAQTALLATKGLPPLPKVASIPGWNRWNHVLAQAEQALSTVYDEMQAYYEERTDDWKDSERAETFVERMEVMEDLIEHVAQCRQQLT